MSDPGHATCRGLELDLQVACEASMELPGAAAFAKWASAALAGEREKAELSIRLVDAEEARELNRNYRDKDYPTNVLSFPADIPEYVELPLLGDIVICAPVVAAEAAEQRTGAEAHWAHMVVHGVLHLLGYDHIEDAEAETMETREREILAGLGFSDPYMPDDK
jgi:probable rRNA maturation factor